MNDCVTIPSAMLRAQLAAIFAAWGMADDAAAQTADVLAQADMMGVDSHGVALMPLYDELRHSGMLDPAAQATVARSFGATAVIDGAGGFGHVPSLMAMDMAIERATALGVGAVAVRNANHYGAAGVYALRAARAGMVGLSVSAVHKPAIVPTFGRAPRLGTNTTAFAAPGRAGPAFLLDMATSTVAIGKLKLAARAGHPLRPGWALDPQGAPQLDADQALIDKLMTPLGGAREGGGHKGYGLAAMVEVLATVLAGATFAPLRAADADRFDVGHFHLALHPQAFREAGDFEDDLDAFVACLRATPPADPAQPVLVAGDPEFAAMAQRAREGVPVPRSLIEQVRGIAGACGAPFTLAQTVA